MGPAPPRRLSPLGVGNQPSEEAGAATLVRRFRRAQEAEGPRSEWLPLGCCAAPVRAALWRLVEHVLARAYAGSLGDGFDLCDAIGRGFGGDPHNLNAKQPPPTTSTTAPHRFSGEQPAPLPVDAHTRAWLLCPAAVVALREQALERCCCGGGARGTQQFCTTLHAVLAACVQFGAAAVGEALRAEARAGGASLLRRWQLTGRGLAGVRGVADVLALRGAELLMRSRQTHAAQPALPMHLSARVWERAHAVGAIDGVAPPRPLLLVESGPGVAAGEAVPDGARGLPVERWPPHACELFAELVTAVEQVGAGGWRELPPVLSAAAQQQEEEEEEEEAAAAAAAAAGTRAPRGAPSFGAAAAGQAELSTTAAAAAATAAARGYRDARTCRLESCLVPPPIGCEACVLQLWLRPGDTVLKIDYHAEAEAEAGGEAAGRGGAGLGPTARDRWHVEGVAACRTASDGAILRWLLPHALVGGWASTALNALKRSEGEGGGWRLELSAAPQDLPGGLELVPRPPPTPPTLPRVSPVVVDTGPPPCAADRPVAGQAGGELQWGQRRLAMGHTIERRRHERVALFGERLAALTDAVAALSGQQLPDSSRSSEPAGAQPLLVAGNHGAGKGTALPGALLLPPPPHSEEVTAAPSRVMVTMGGRSAELASWHPEGGGLTIGTEHNDAPCPPFTSHGASIANPRLTIGGTEVVCCECGQVGAAAMVHVCRRLGHRHYRERPRTQARHVADAHATMRELRELLPPADGRASRAALVAVGDGGDDAAVPAGESFLRVHWVAVPQALRARRVSRSWAWWGGGAGGGGAGPLAARGRPRPHGRAGEADGAGRAAGAGLGGGAGAGGAVGGVGGGARGHARRAADGDLAAAGGGHRVHGCAEGGRQGWRARTTWHHPAGPRADHQRRGAQ
jgi:hypothetical protein